MFISKLRFNKNIRENISIMFFTIRVITIRGIYGFRHFRVLYLIRRGFNTYVFNHRGMRGKRTENNSSILLFLLYFNRISTDAIKHILHLQRKWDYGLLSSVKLISEKTIRCRRAENNILSIFC
jgi:hypothetical protein